MKRPPLMSTTRILGFTFLLLFSTIQDVWGQAGLRESLEHLDVNQDGRIDPEEITPLARPYLEQISRARRLSLERSNRIETLLEAARVYFAFKNGAYGRDFEYEDTSTLLPFGPAPDAPLIPEFGLPIVRYPYTQQDLEEADQILRRYDRNEDGYIDRSEAARSRWTHMEPFDTDFDKDGRLNRLELGQRYARRRLLSDTADELERKAERVGSEARLSSSDGERRDESQWWRQGGSRYYLTASVLGRFDANRNGRLEMNEAQDLGIPFGRLDVDRDGELSRDELYAYLSEKQDEAGDLTEGLPGWFYELDADRDGQVAMSEYASEWTETKLQQFMLMDTNSDGLLTALELAKSKSLMGGSYSNQVAEVLPPHKTVISEIEVQDDLLIGDLNVRLSITHSNTSFLDAYLTGPDGQRIELFTEVGDSGDNFEETLFDDQSRYPINKARPPFKGTFLPEGVLNRQPGLSHFNGHNARGVWQLIIRGTRSERFGMLHHWSLVFKAQEDMLSGSEPAPETDGPVQLANNNELPPQRQDASKSQDGSEGKSLIRMMAGESAPDLEGTVIREKLKALEGLDDKARQEQLAKIKEWALSKRLGKEPGDKKALADGDGGRFKEDRKRKKEFKESGEMKDKENRK